MLRTDHKSRIVHSRLSRMVPAKSSARRHTITRTDVAQANCVFFIVKKDQIIYLCRRKNIYWTLGRRLESTTLV